MPAAGIHVASMPVSLPIQARRTPSPSRARSARASARPAAVWPPVPPPARTTVSGTGGEGGPSRRPGARGSGTRRGATALGSEPPLSGVALESQLDQAVDQLRVRQAGGLPEARIGGEPGESWNGVDLVHPDARLALEKEVDA